MAKKRSDYNIRSYFGTVNPDKELWQVMIGDDHLITTCRTLEEAQETIRRLDADPYALERGNTQVDRSNMQVPWKLQ